MGATQQIVGREAELATVDRFLVAPTPAVLVLEGEAGCGKTTVFEHALTAGGQRRLVARPTEAESTLSLSTVADVLAEVDLQALDGLPAPQRRALRAALLLDEPGEDAAGDPRTLAVAFLTAVRELARAQPVIVAVDDVQWADAASAAILAFAARRLRDEPVRLLYGLRIEPGTSAAALEAVPSVERLAIGPMPERDIFALLRGHGTARAPAVVRAIHDRSGGNPFYALELARALERAPRPAPGEELPLPPSLHDLVRGRLAALPRRTREALLATALLGDARLDVLGRVDDLEALEPAVADDVVRIDGDRVRFSHPLLSAGARAEANPLAELRMHDRLAGAVADPEQRVRHRARACPGYDTTVAGALDEALARAQARGDEYGVAELAELALKLTPAGDPAHVRRLLRACRAAMMTGSGERARALARTAVERAASREERTDALRLLANSTANMETALSLMERAVAAAGDDLPRLVALRAEYSGFLLITGRVTAALDEAAAVVELAERLGDREWLAVTLSVHGYMARAAGRAALREELDRAVALAPDTRLGVFGRGPAVNRAVCLVYDERLDEARDVFEGVAAEARERGHEVDLAIALFQLGELECRAGRYAEAERHARAMMEGFVVENPQDRSGTMYVLAWAEAFMGRVDDARAHAREGARLSRETGDQLFWSQNEAVLGFLELSLGNLAAADRHLRPLWPAVTALGYGEPSVWPVLPNEIEALIGMGELEPAEAFLAELEERGRALDSAWALSQAARCRGLLLAATGAPQEALGAFAAALEQHRRMAGGFERARTLLAQGRTLRRMKRWREAREALQAALAIFEELGTPLWVAQAREALARIGGRAPGRDSLTSTEQRVAALVAEGRSNREVAAQLFVSVRTVEASLTRIYAKLGVRSRAQLARRLASGSPPFR